MHTKFKHIIIIFSALCLNACGVPKSESLAAAILPADCQLQAGEQVALTLDGQIPANTNIQWTTNIGDVVWTGQGLTATFLAPNNPGEATITVSFVSGTPTPYSASRTCLITTNTSLVASLIPVNSPSPAYSVVMSEIMGNPCGDIASNKFNQYVELYNYGDQPVDVGGWWLFDEGEKGTPDKLVAWDSRSTNHFNPNLITSTTVIPARSFAVIISPMYVDSDIPQRMPYNFPANTIILTVESSQTVGDDYFGIISSENGYDTLTLYTGSASVMDKVVDTYGTPKISSAYPVDINDDYLDHAPLYLSECVSAERVNPLLPDSETNWVTLFGGSPGDGPYK